MVRRAASNMRKDLTCTKVLEIIMQPDPSSELQYVLSQITDYNRCKGSVENLHKVCAITHLFLQLFLLIFTEFVCLLEINLKDTVCVLTMFA